MPFPNLQANQIHPATGRNRLAEADFISAAESDETLPADELTGVEAGQLRARLDHEHTGENRPPGNMAGDPELVISDVLEADDLPNRRIGVNNAIQMLHVPALRIAGTNLLLIVNDLVEVDSRDV